jgi:hypothetical protein
MVDRLENMLARWPVLMALLAAACSVGGMFATVAFLSTRIDSTTNALSKAKIEAHDARTTQILIMREMDSINARINRLEGNATFGRDRNP